MDRQKMSRKGEVALVPNDKMELLLRSALKRQAEQMQAPSDMANKILTHLDDPVEKHPLQAIRWFRWRKMSAAVLCGILLFISVALAVSPQARALAIETVSSLLLSFKLEENGKWTIYGTLLDENGHEKNTVKIAEGGIMTLPDGIDNDNTQVTEIKVTDIQATEPLPELSTPAEAAEKAGFSFSLPAFLPDAYVRQSMVASKWDNGKGFVHVDYVHSEANRQSLRLMITNEPAFFHKAEHAQEVTIGDTIAFWSVQPILSVPPSSSVTAAHQLMWRHGDLVYILTDFSGQLPMEEMIKMAASTQ